jgi:hypothetical protein
MRNGGFIGKNPIGYGKFNLQDQYSGQVDDSWPTDPYWGSVVYLNHCNGTNGATYVPAERGGALIPVNSAGLVTSTSKFGGASYSFDGTSQGASVQSNDFAFGTADFTVEFWMNPTTGGHGAAYSRIIQLGANSTNGGLWIVCNASTVR